MKRLWLLPLFALLGLAGCTTPPGEPTGAAALEATDERFAPLDRGAAEAVACTGFFPRRTAAGLLEVAVNLQNRTAAPVRLKVNCVFKDVQGFTLQDETPFRPLAIAAGATETVRFTATNPAAQRYTVRVRTAR
ncbi:MAG: YcfL family protein [Cephaloticoccus sp.]